MVRKSKKSAKRYLHEDRHGRWRVRKDGKYYPIRDEHDVWHDPDTPEGDRVYWEIMTGKRAEAKRGWSQAIDLLMEHDSWTKKSARYRADLEPILLYLKEKNWQTGCLTAYAGRYLRRYGRE